MCKRSSTFKMLECRVSDDRQIAEFPSPFDENCTPHLDTDFSAITREFCLREQEICTVTLKICKIIVLGDVCAGKTSIVNRFCCKLFESTYKSTIGVDFQIEHFNILGVPYTLQIWDTAGQERFKCIAQSYYRGAHVIILVFDLSSVQTLFNCNNWLEEALEVSKSPSPYIFVVGTKMDLVSQQAYINTNVIARQIAKSLKAELWTISSKTGENVDKLFHRIAALSFNDCIRNLSKKSSSDNIKIGSSLISFKKNAKKSKKKGRCETRMCSNV